MPSVLTPTQHITKSYAPLADEVNPPFGNIAPAPTVTENGTIVYDQRVASATSVASSSAGSDDLERVCARLKNDSQETLSPTRSWKGKTRTESKLQDEETDVGEFRKSSYKGKERAWDVEQGQLTSAERIADSQYPPVNEVEEEERKIQNNLSKMAARDAAKRRAARESKQLNASPVSNSSSRSSFTISSVTRQPFSFLGSIPKRNSFMGIDALLNVKKEEQGLGELPTSRSRPNDVQYNNPYDPQPAFSPAPKMTVSPQSTPSESPFVDPSPSLPLAVVAGPSHHRRPSLVSPLPATSPLPIKQSVLISPATSPTEETGFSYGGPTWRGGQAVQQHEEAPRKGPDRWWHALCAWGNDLDGGHDVKEGNGGQAGRTNPFE
ncbi:hypothetical protein L204_101533 [Cryptococcus depauperatus]